MINKLFLLSLLICLLTACGDNKKGDNTQDDTSKANGAVFPGDSKAGAISTYDPHRGEGKFTSVELGTTIDATKASTGDKVYQVKCSGCHKVTGEKLVGPGWAGVTTRHSPEWIMNFITNTDAMIDKDPAVQAQLEICLIRMPNQNLSDDDARNLLEFMRKNDAIK